MIHQLMVLDRTKGIGITLYDNKELYADPDLLIGLVQALMALGEEMGPVKGLLREAELGKYQLSILSRDSLVYIAIHDTYDSEPFTNKILENIIDKYQDQFVNSNFHVQIEDNKELRKDIAEMLNTMKFPRELLGDVKQIITRFQLRVNYIVDTILLADLDDGIIDIFSDVKDDSIIKILMEILSEIPFERHWIGQSRLKSPKVINGNVFEYEVWLIYRIGLTDFCVMGRAYLTSLQDQDVLLVQLEQLVEEISSLLFQN